jgi:hypothetical protein
MLTTLDAVAVSARDSKLALLLPACLQLRGTGS